MPVHSRRPKSGTPGRTDHTTGGSDHGGVLAVDEGISQKAFIRTLTPRLQKLGWWGKADCGGQRRVTQKKCNWAVPAVWRLIYNV